MRLRNELREALLSDLLRTMVKSSERSGISGMSLRRFSQSHRRVSCTSSSARDRGTKREA